MKFLWLLGPLALIALASGQETTETTTTELPVETKKEEESPATGKTANDDDGGFHRHHGHKFVLRGLGKKSSSYSSSHHSSSKSSSHHSSSYDSYDSYSKSSKSSYHSSSDSDFYDDSSYIDSYDSSDSYDSYDSSYSSHDKSVSESYVRYGPNHCVRKDCHRSHGHVGIVQCDRVCDGGVRLSCKRECDGKKKKRRCSETCRNHGQKYFQHKFKRDGSKLWHWTKYWDIHGEKFECQARCRIRHHRVFCRKRCYKEDHLISDRLVSYDLYSNSIHASNLEDLKSPFIAHDLPTKFAAPGPDDPIIVADATAKDH